MIAVLQEQSNSGDDHPAEHDRKELKRKALKARKELKDAKKLANKVAVGDVLESQLSSDQITLLRHLDLGLLENKRKASDDAYGHGAGVKPYTREQAALVRMTHNELDRYFHR